MLYTGVNHFNWEVNNYVNLAAGINSPGHANAHEKGATTEMLVGLAYDCWGLSICMVSGSGVGVARKQLTDVLIDPAAGVGNSGSSWTVLINNLFTQGPVAGAGQFGHWFYFPIFIPAGTAIATAHQDGTAGTLSTNIKMRVYGQPTRPDLVKVGHKVQTLGANTGTTAGTSVTPSGSGVFGSYSSSLGTLTNDAWWWQLGVGASDTTMAALTYHWDVAVNATNKLTCIHELTSASTADEGSSKQAMAAVPPMRHVAAGEDVYVRGTCVNTTPDGGFTAVVYAVT